MIDMTRTIIPKSDQLNADDLIGKNITVKITRVLLTDAADQPVAIHFEGDEGKPYKLCKSMRRVLVNVWGPDASKYAGRSMRLYRDDKVQFGGLAVGGIRISHLSHIDAPVTMALTASRANRKPFTVKPLKEAPEQPRERSEADVAPDSARAAHGPESAPTVDPDAEPDWADLIETRILDALDPAEAMQVYTDAINSGEWRKLKDTDLPRAERIKSQAQKRKAEMKVTA